MLDEEYGTLPPSLLRIKLENPVPCISSMAKLANNITSLIVACMARSLHRLLPAPHHRIWGPTCAAVAQHGYNSDPANRFAPPQMACLGLIRCVTATVAVVSK